RYELARRLGPGCRKWAWASGCVRLLSRGLVRPANPAAVPPHRARPCNAGRLRRRTSSAARFRAARNRRDCRYGRRSRRPARRRPAIELGMRRDNPSKPVPSPDRWRRGYDFRRAEPERALDLEHFMRHLIVQIPWEIQATLQTTPGVERPVHAAERTGFVQQERGSDIARPGIVRADLDHAHMV